MYMRVYKAFPAFEDRFDAGRKLVEFLQQGPQQGKAVVLGLPRGGVPAAWPLAQAMNAMLDVVVVRKLPLPGNPEAGFGAVAIDGSRFLNEAMLEHVGLTPLLIESITDKVRREVRRRAREYPGHGPIAARAGRGCLSGGRRSRNRLHHARSRRYGQEAPAKISYLVRPGLTLGFRGNGATPISTRFTCSLCRNDYRLPLLLFTVTFMIWPTRKSWRYSAKQDNSHARSMELIEGVQVMTFQDFFDFDTPVDRRGTPATSGKCMKNETFFLSGWPIWIFARHPRS